MGLAFVTVLSWAVNRGDLLAWVGLFLLVWSYLVDRANKPCLVSSLSHLMGYSMFVDNPTCPLSCSTYALYVYLCSISIYMQYILLVLI